MREGSGWYTLPSGRVVHLAALDQVAEAATRRMAVVRLRNILHAIAAGSSTYRPNGIMRRPVVR